MGAENSYQKYFIREMAPVSGRRRRVTGENQVSQRLAMHSSCFTLPNHSFELTVHFSQNGDVAGESQMRAILRKSGHFAGTETKLGGSQWVKNRELGRESGFASNIISVGSSCIR